MDMNNDTIAAVATAPGMAAIAVVRVSGPGSLDVADRVFSGAKQRPSQWPANTFRHGRIIGKDMAVLDEVILLVMRAPKSYTREHVVEIQCHGGARSAARILQRIMDMGVRLAGPGEFTRRAFLNGRIDLAQAESVMDLISASTDRASSAALEQLNGRLSHEINRLYEKVLACCANIEATLDFLDDELPQHVRDEIISDAETAVIAVDRLVGTWKEGHLIRDGALVVISGRPNAGKSTLMNALLGKNRAIVSHIPGTTRDTIEEQLVIEDVMIRLVDTAGLCDSSCAIEKDGIKRARALMAASDLTLYIMDASEPIHSDDRENIAGLDPKKTIIVLNKADLPLRIDSNGAKLSIATSEPTPRFADPSKEGMLLADNRLRMIPSSGWVPKGRGGCGPQKDLNLAPFRIDSGFDEAFTMILASMVNGKGLDAIRKEVVDKLLITPCHEPHAVISERHRQSLSKALEALKQGIELIKSGDEHLVPAASYFRESATSLAEITGREYYEDMLDQVFSRFCVGK